ncbi:UNVERIFIED_CONTAM: hypothetical protein HDU68_009883, partial [Siphonaria sp. JEL0065]
MPVATAKPMAQKKNTRSPGFDRRGILNLHPGSVVDNIGPPSLYESFAFLFIRDRRDVQIFNVAFLGTNGGSCGYWQNIRTVDGRVAWLKERVKEFSVEVVAALAAVKKNRSAAAPSSVEKD